jgi:3-phenylpropionate/trans-cinnamate dioxygenase ferredoxin reductase subunit
MGLRIESVQNAVEQARLLANNLLGHPAPYRAVPWFWSEQRELKLQMAGLSSGYDATVSLGDPDSQCFSVLCFRERRLVAVESLNQPLEHMLARKLLARAAGLTPADAGAYGFDLKQYERETRL